jgi:hypothetical protein
LVFKSPKFIDDIFLTVAVAAAVVVVVVVVVVEVATKVYPRTQFYVSDTYGRF